MRKLYIISKKKKVGLSILRIETNIASEILPKHEQGSTLLEENNRDHVIKDCSILVA